MREKERNQDRKEDEKGKKLWEQGWGFGYIGNVGEQCSYKFKPWIQQH